MDAKVTYEELLKEQISAYQKILRKNSELWNTKLREFKRDQKDDSCISSIADERSELKEIYKECSEANKALKWRIKLLQHELSKRRN